MSPLHFVCSGKVPVRGHPSPGSREMKSGQMIRRMFGATFFDAHTYEEIEADPGSMVQAIGVVLLVTLCAITGGLIDEIPGHATLWEVTLELGFGLAFGVLRWALWVTIVFMVGGGLLRTGNTETDWAEMGRILGFALTPGILAIFSSVPFVDWVFVWVAVFWSLAAAVLGVRQGMDYESTGRAMLVVAISGLIAVIPLALTFSLQSRVFSYFT